MTTTGSDARQALRESVLSGAPNATVETLANQLRTDGMTVAHVVIDTLHAGDRLERDQQRVLIKWCRRAAADGDHLATWPVGRQWAYGGSNAHLRWNDQLSDDDAVSSEEAQIWVQAAADHGIREAGLIAAENAPDHPRAIEWLTTAYADGEPDDQLDRGQIQDAAYMLASLFADSDPSQARKWFRLAVEGAPWVNDSTARTTAWEEAVADFARFLHVDGDLDSCAAWCWRLVENAANDGPADRAFMASEHKVYRNDWQVSRGQESARIRTLRHLLSEHPIRPHDRWELCSLLSNSRWLDESDAQLMADVLCELISDESLDQLAGTALEQDRASLHRMTGRQVWALTHWILADAVPAAFRFCGLDAAAAAFGDAVPLLPARDGTYKLSQRLEELFVWPERQANVHPAHDPSSDFATTYARASVEHRAVMGPVKELLKAMGLAEKSSIYQSPPTSESENQTYADGSGSWRLLRGQRLWIALYLAVSAPERSVWVETWDLASLLLVRALAKSIEIVSDNVGADLSERLAWDSEMRDHLTTLQKAFKLSLDEFVAAARNV